MADEILCSAQNVTDAWPGFSSLTPSRQTSLIASASQLVHNHCRRWFTQTLWTETFDGNNQPRLWLSHRPVGSVQSVTVNGDSLDNSDSTGWTVNPGTGELVRGNGLDDVRFPEWFPAGSRNVSVVYWAGYVIPPNAGSPQLPDPVIEATVKTAKWLWDLDQTGGSGVMSSERIGSYQYSRADQRLVNGLPGHIAVIVENYVQDEAFV